MNMRARIQAGWRLLEWLESRVLLTVTQVPANGDLQFYINTASPGDTLVLPANGVYTGHFTLPVKTGAAMITIQSADLAFLPANTRVGPADAIHMPKIVTNTTSSVLAADASSHHYAFIGIEFKPQSASVSQGDLIKLGTSGTAQDELSEVPHDFLFDRCYLHGYPVTDYKRGIALNSYNTTVSNSYLADFHSTGQDAQALGGWNGPGNFAIINNYLEASGENILFGGADATIPNLVPTNIVIRNNLVSKPLSWYPGDPSYAGTDYSVKNLFELKNAQNVIVDQNIFENNWVDSQTGFAILLKSANQGGANPWAVTANLTFTNNIIRHSANAFNYINVDGPNTAVPIHDVLIANNLFYDIGGTRWGGNGIGFQLLKGLASGTNVTFEHNTLISKYNFLAPDAGSATNKTVINNFIFRNNIVEKAQYGAKGSGTAEGTTTLQTFFPGYTFQGNVVIGGNSSIYPTGNFFPASDNTVGWKDFAGEKFYLAAASAYKNAATDGTDPGVNWTHLAAEFFHPIAGDVNMDGTVDGGDFDIWFLNLQKSSWFWTDGDLTRDGRIDGADFDAWFTHLGNTGGPVAAAVVAPMSFATLSTTTSTIASADTKKIPAPGWSRHRPSLVHSKKTGPLQVAGNVVVQMGETTP